MLRIGLLSFVFRVRVEIGVDLGVGSRDFVLSKGLVSLKSVSWIEGLCPVQMVWLAPNQCLLLRIGLYLFREELLTPNIEKVMVFPKTVS